MTMRIGIAVAAFALAAGPAWAAPRCAAAGHPYDLDNPIAKILRGEGPVIKVYEDAHVLALMPLRMTSPGHTVVVSKTSCARDITEAEPEELARVMTVVQRLARVQKAALRADGVNIRQNNGAVAGQTVFHMHFHVVPRYAGLELLTPEGPPTDRAEVEKYAAVLRAAMR